MSATGPSGYPEEISRCHATRFRRSVTGQPAV
jgi:hypothetical protein